MLQTVNYKLIYANSLLVALFIAQTCIASVINSFLTIPKISVIISLILFFVAISLNRNTKFCKQVVISYALIFLLLSFSLIVNGVESCIDYILHYIVFGTTAFVLSNIPLNGKVIINSSIYIYIVYLIVFFLRIRMDYLEGDDLGTIQMGVAYSFVPGVLWAISLLFFPGFIIGNRYLKQILSIVVLIGSIYVVLFLTVTRGAIIAILFGCVFIAIFHLNKINRLKFIIVFLGGTIFLFLNIETVLEDFFYISSENSIGAIKKMSSLSNDGDVSNGRDLLYESAIDIIRSSPMIGKGVGYFEKINEIYVHQLFLQILCEMGMLGLFLFLFPITKIVKATVISNLASIYIIPIVLISSILIMLLFSNVYWLSPNFWFLFFLTPYHLKLVSKTDDIFLSRSL